MYVFICSLVVRTLVAWSSYTSMTRNTSSRHSTHNIYLPIFGYSLGGKCRWIQQITTRLFPVFSTGDKNVTPWNSLKLNSQSLWKPFVFMCLSLAIISFKDGKVRWFYPITLASKGWKKLGISYHKLILKDLTMFFVSNVQDFGAWCRLNIAVRVGGSINRLLRLLRFQNVQTRSIAKKMGPSTLLLCCFPGTAFPHVFNLQHPFFIPTPITQTEAVVFHE